MSDVGVRIKVLRERKNIRQSEVAQALEMEPANYSRLEKRGDKMTVEQLKKIAGVLNVRPSDLIEDSEPTQKSNNGVERITEQLLEIAVAEIEDWKRKAKTSIETETIRYAHEHGYPTTLPFPDDVLEQIFEEYLIRVPIFRKAIRTGLVNRKVLTDALENSLNRYQAFFKIPSTANNSESEQDQLSTH